MKLAKVAATKFHLTVHARQRIAEREFPDLREAYLHLIQTGDMQLDRYGFVRAEADRMVNSLNTLREQTTDWTRGTAAQSKRTMDVKFE